MKPLGNRLVILPAEAEKFTASGLVIPESMQAEQSMGTIKFVGPEVKALKKNDFVLYGKYAGTRVELKGVEYLIVKEEDILLVLDK